MGCYLPNSPLGGSNDVIYKLFPPRESLVSDILTGDGNIEKLFLCYIFENDLLHQLVQVVLADVFISRNMLRRAGHGWYLSLGAGFFSLGFIVATTSS